MISHLRRGRSFVSVGTQGLLVGLLFAFSILAFPSCEPGKETGNPKKKTEEEEKRDEGERKETEASQNLPPEDIKSTDQLQIPNSPAGQAIMVHFEAAYAIGEGAEKNYAESLQRLRRTPGEVSEILTKAYGELDQEMYTDRWLILQTMADMAVDEGLDPLVRFASADLPQRDTNQYTENVSSYQEESILRITAIRGIAALIEDNDKAAEVMPRFFDHKDPTIRLEALNSFADEIRRIRDRGRRAELIKFFPGNYEFELKPVNPDPGGIAGEDPTLKPKGEGKGAAPKK